MMNKLIGRLGAAACLAALLYVSTGCNEATMLGQNLIPGSDYVNTFDTDTFTVKTSTVYRTDDSSVANYSTLLPAGAINSDPVFGRTTAILYAQFGLVGAGFSFSGTNPVLDSVVLSLAYSGYYGDSLGQQKYAVYRIDDPAFNDTTLYYVHGQIPIDPSTVLGTALATPHGLEDSVSIYGTSEAPQLRIRLSNAFGNELLQQTADGAFYSDSAFYKFLNGLAVVPDSTTTGRNSMIYFELNSAYTGINVYYHNSTQDSLQAFFPFDVSTSGFSYYIRRDYSGTVASGHFSDTASATGDSLVYLQSSPGLYSNIEIPYLQDFPNAVINKAELIITQVPDPGSSVFNAPPSLFLWKYKDTGQDSLGYIYDAGAVIDPAYGLQFTNLAYFGGVRKIVTDSQGRRVAQYRINITRYLQHLISGNPSYHETNYGFRLVVLDASGSTHDIGRVVLGGGTNKNYAMKLHVIYTKIK